ncbi:uncharacterized protein [Musca autumnalis]|uniref:uncharacterized protein n=1 Tax=Musca autumnalis TaxID=221902 RepID=UPI003CF6E8A1
MKCSSNHLNIKTIGSSSSMCFQLQQILALLLMVIALCASSITGSPTQQPRQLQQNQQKEQLQRQQEHQNHQTTKIRVQQCREGCLEKFVTKSPLCQKTPKCSECLNECGQTAQGNVTSSIRETWPLRTVSMVQHDTLVLVDVAWDQSSVPFQCLVTWEVSGGGLMGNLLTESFGVQLSLWPDTKYRVQVTCKNKRSGLMSRSLPLSLDTSEAIKMPDPEVKTEDISNTIFTKVPNSSTPQTTTKPLTVSFPSSPDLKDDAIDTNVVGYHEQNQSEETDEHQGSTLFLWNSIRRHKDIATIEPLRPAEVDILTTLTNSHRPLLYTMVAVIVLLIFILVFCACSLRNPRLSGDKVMLIAEDFTTNQHGSVEKLSSKTPVSCNSHVTCSRHTPRV